MKNEYDRKGRVTRQLLSNGQEYVVLYDDANRRNTFLTPSTGSRMVYEYNAKQMIVKTIYPDDTAEEVKYDEWQNKIWEKDRNGGERHCCYNERGLLLEERLPNGLVTAFTYDKQDNLICRSDNAGREWKYTYDERGNCIKSSIRLDGARQMNHSFTYDARGRQLSKTDGNGNTTTYQYRNELGRPSTITLPEGEVFTFTYDEAGRQMSMRDAYGQTGYAYNQMDYRTMITDPLGNITKHSFDKLCNRTKTILPNEYDPETGDGAGTCYVFDAMDKLVGKVRAEGGVSVLLRDREENVIKEIHPEAFAESGEAGAGIEFDYDPENRRIRIHYPDGGTERIFYDANGNQIKRVQPESYDKNQDDEPGYTYLYDCVNRLVQVTAPDGTVEKRYVYDLCGNVVKEINAAGYLSGKDDESRYGTEYQYNALECV